LLFQGQEFSCTSPFLFFADHTPELAAAVREGRAKLLAKFPRLATPEMQARLADPSAEATFQRCKIDWSERKSHQQALALHSDLLALRRSDPVLSQQGLGGVDGAVLDSEAFVLRLFGGDHGDRLLLINLGDEVLLAPAPEPLLAPPQEHGWQLLWSSDDAKYGGRGKAAVARADGWILPAESATVLKADDHAQIA
jgi:maltooligosyltrehalose trehalohydrolase